MHRSVNKIRYAHAFPKTTHEHTIFRLTHTHTFTQAGENVILEHDADIAQH